MGLQAARPSKNQPVPLGGQEDNPPADEPPDPGRSIPAPLKLCLLSQCGSVYSSVTIAVYELCQWLIEQSTFPFSLVFVYSWWFNSCGSRRWILTPQAHYPGSPVGQGCGTRTFETIGRTRPPLSTDRFWKPASLYHFHRHLINCTFEVRVQMYVT